MTHRMARLFVRLYPQSWRERYGDEMEALLLQQPGGLRTSSNLAWAALCERILPTGGQPMNQPVPSLLTLTRRPSAFVPVLLSLAGLVLVISRAVVYGISHHTDEGAAAHLWQILMATQILTMIFFVVRWWPRARRAAIEVIALQMGVTLANLAAVFFLT